MKIKEVLAAFSKAAKRDFKKLIINAKQMDANSTVEECNIDENTKIILQ